MQKLLIFKVLRALHLVCACNNLVVRWLFELGRLCTLALLTFLAVAFGDTRLLEAIRSLGTQWFDLRRDTPIRLCKQVVVGVGVLLVVDAHGLVVDALFNDSSGNPSCELGLGAELD